MFAAIYARKSTEQAGITDEQHSITLQVEDARSYAAAKGWTVDDASIYVDWCERRAPAGGRSP